MWRVDGACLFWLEGEIGETGQLQSGRCVRHSFGKILKIFRCRQEIDGILKNAIHSTTSGMSPNLDVPPNPRFVTLANGQACGHDPGRAFRQVSAIRERDADRVDALARMHADLGRQRIRDVLARGISGTLDIAPDSPPTIGDDL